MPTSIPVDDLVARLRLYAEDFRAFNGEHTSGTRLASEAADRLEAQAAEIARLREALSAIEQHLTATTDLGWHHDQALRLACLSQPGGEK